MATIKGFAHLASATDWVVAAAAADWAIAGLATATDRAATIAPN